MNTPPPSDPGASSGPLPSALGRFMDESEFPPDFVSEQKSVLLQPGHVLANRFEIREMLGFGGMGTVYRVTDWRLQEDKALKIMLPSLVSSEAARQRFLAEIKISQRLSHDRIVRVHDFGEDPENNVQFFTMEFVEGKTLHKHLIERGGRLDLDEALEIFAQLLEALSYAHTQTIHRDLKPQNVMLRPNGSIKVLDFGLAKLMSPGRMAKSSMALGTAYYQAPEQSVRKGEVDQRADVYSLGVILYEMLVGELPVGRFDPPSHRVSGLAKRLDDVILKCLHPQPEGRYNNVAELQEALEAARTAKPIVATSRRMGLIGVAVLAVVVIGLLAIMMRPSGEEPAAPGAAEVPAEPPEDIAQPADTSLADARRAAEKAQAAAADAWTSVPAEADTYAAALLEEGEQLMNSAAAAFGTGESQQDPASFDSAAEHYVQAAERFVAARDAAEEGMAEAAAEPAVTPEQAASTRQAAEEARSAAVAAGLTDEALGVADGLMTQGDALLAEGDTAEAAGIFEQARAQFAQLGTAAVDAMARDTEVARADAETARTEAADAGATQEDLAAGDEAWSRATELMTAGDHEAAQAAYVEAGEAYQHAAETRAQMAEVEQAEGAATSARAAAVAEGANADELANGDRALESAKTAHSDANYLDAVAHFGTATAEFKRAQQAAVTRANSMQENLEQQLGAKIAAATSAREALTESLRAYAPKDAQAADSAWDAAVKANDGGNIEVSIQAYERARAAYAGAANSANDIMNAERNRLAQAKGAAESQRTKVNDAVRAVAGDDVDAGEASYAKGVALESTDLDAALKHFNDAESAFRRAVNTHAEQAKAMDAEKQREADAKAEADAAAAAKAAQDKARRDMNTAKSTAETARANADTAVVREHASSEFATATNAFNEARSAEQGGKFDQARSFYATAKTGFDNAVTLANEREAEADRAAEMAAQARDTMNAAKSGAQSARTAANTETTRSYAATELQQAERYYNDAESAAASGNFERAAGLYDQARSAYASAQSQGQTRMQQESAKEKEDEGNVPLYLRKRGIGR